MPAASYKKDMVGRTRISDRLDIEYLHEIRFLGIALRFSQKMCKAVRHHVLWPTFWAYFCWFFKCCFASLLHHFEKKRAKIPRRNVASYTNLLLKTIQYFRKPRFGVLTRSIINYKYDFEMRKKKRSEMANFYMTWWCVCVCTYDFLCILCLATFSANLWIANWAIQKGWMKMKLRFLRYSVKSDAKKNQHFRIIRYIVFISMVILDRT